eukprot:6113492-Pleurochrysis_carterae.AAC.1
MLRDHRAAGAAPVRAALLRLPLRDFPFPATHPLSPAIPSLATRAKSSLAKLYAHASAGHVSCARMRMLRHLRARAAPLPLHNSSCPLCFRSHRTPRHTFGRLRARDSACACASTCT